MAQHPVWKSGEQLAWTDHDGPGRPPAASNRALWFVLAAVLGVVFAGMVITDVLCPEHRAWVQALGSFALFGTATSVVALIRGWSSAPVITLASAATGVAIGAIDASHDPTRGRLIAVAFAVVVIGAWALYVRQLMLARWERNALTASPVEEIQGVDPVAEATPAVSPTVSIEQSQALTPDEVPSRH